MMERLTCGPRNAVYMSPDIQNRLLGIMATMVRKTNCEAVQSAGPFSLLEKLYTLKVEGNYSESCVHSGMT